MLLRTITQLNLKNNGFIKNILITLSLWFIIMAIGSFFLFGRYNWAVGREQFSIKSYSSSLYFFLIITPLSYYLVLVLSNKKRLAFGVSIVVFIIGCLPYEWLGLANLRYITKSYHWNTPGIPPPQLNWLPEALSQVDFPGEKKLFVAALALFTIIAFLFAFFAQGWNWNLKRIQPTLKRIVPLVLVFLAILTQTWLHSSMRSPYNYLTNFDKPKSANNWYHSYLFDNEQGAVSDDLFVFITLDEYFAGDAKPVQTMLIRRSFVHYISAQFSYFINIFYVFLILNSLFWFSAVIAAYYYFKKVLGNSTVALYVAALVNCGTGFIFFSAQPMSYLAAYAIIIIILYLTEYLLVREEVGLIHIITFGATLGLCACIYDIFPIYPMLILYGFFRHIKFWKILLGLILSAIIYYGFIYLQFNILGLVETDINSKFVTGSLDNAIKLITDFQLGKFYFLSIGLFKTYIQNLGFAFLLLGLVVALIGLFVTSSKKERILLGLLFLPSFLLNMILYYGGMVWGGILFAEIPRYTYIAYPAIYLAIALVLYQLRNSLEQTRLAKVAPYLPWLVIACFFAWHNVDVLGFPSMYYHFCIPTHNVWLNPG